MLSLVLPISFLLLASCQSMPCLHSFSLYNASFTLSFEHFRENNSKRETYTFQHAPSQIYFLIRTALELFTSVKSLQRTH